MLFPGPQLQIVIVNMVNTKSAQERAARVRAYNFVKFETEWTLPPALKLVTCPVHAALT